MNYFIFIVVYFMPWIMLGMSLILFGSFLYYITFKNKNDIHYYLRSLFNFYGKYLIFNIVFSLVILSVRLNMELMIGYAITYIAIFILLNVRETKYLKEIILIIIILVLVTFFFSSTFLNLLNSLLNFLFPFV
jgi:hypothetical protein